MDLSTDGGVVDEVVCCYVFGVELIINFHSYLRIYGISTLTQVP